MTQNCLFDHREDPQNLSKIKKYKKNPIHNEISKNEARIRDRGHKLPNQSKPYFFPKLEPVFPTHMKFDVRVSMAR